MEMILDDIVTFGQRIGVGSESCQVEQAMMLLTGSCGWRNGRLPLGGVC